VPVGQENVSLPPLPANPSIALLTMSFRGDLELCRLLCETVDMFVPAAFEHVLAVPRADLPLFAPMANSRRRLVTQEELLPTWLHRIPMPPPGLRRLLRLPRRNMYVTGNGRLVRGWVAQQLMKLAAARAAAADVILHVDSDAAFVRPLAPEHLCASGRVRLLHTAGAGDTPMHHPWHRTASGLLGLPPTDYHGADYIGNLTTWRPAVVQRMLDHIAGVTGADGVSALAATADLSEYTLYGVYCDKVLGLDAAGHAPTSRLLCATVWPGLETSELDAHFDALTIAPDQIAVGVQSTIPVSMDQRRRLVHRLSRAG
jgi:hypothetical protein